jgi:hypothetical protein
MAIDMLEKTNKNGKCKIEKIDDIMCPKLADVDSAKGEKRKELGEKVTKCLMQCALCKNFPDSLSGASTILMGATVAFAGAALF